MLRWVYSAACFLVLTGASPWILFRLFTRKKFRERVMERMGRLTLDIPSGPCLWFHGASVGEVLAGKPVIDALLNRYPDLHIVLSVMTDTGYEVAEKRIKGLAGIIQAPVDFHGIVHRVMNVIRPDGVVILETELWPNLIWTASERVPVLLINGRISERSYPGYMRARFLFADVLKHLTALGVQTEADAARFLDMGAPKTSIHVLGNVKFDVIPENDTGELGAFFASVGWDADDRIIVAGSTHHGEEEVLIDVFFRLTHKYRRLRLVLAPRHLERLPELEALLKRKGCRYVRRSMPENTGSSVPDIVLLDTFGELGRAYSAAEVVFVGGSLVDIGGHNMLEPAAVGKPILFGPHVQNFREVSERLLSMNAAVEIEGTETLERALDALLEAPSEALAMGKRARAVVEDNSGAVDRYVALIERYVPSAFGRRHGTEEPDGR